MRTLLLTILLVLALRGSDSSNHKPRPRPTPAPTASPTATPIPTPTQTPPPTARPAPTPVACLPAQAPPPPVGVLVCNANAQQGADLGQKINACDRWLGAKVGEIRARPAEGAAGRLDTQMTISSGHTLRFAAGHYRSQYMDSGPDGIIRLKDGARLYGAGMCETWLYESAVGTQGAAYNNWTVVMVYANSVDHNAVARDVHVSDFGVMGANPDFYGTAQTVALGNCHGCSARRVKLKGTTTIGIQAGEGSATGQSADGVVIADNVLESVASQSLACVNCVNVTFENNHIIRPGATSVRSGSTGITPGQVPIDLEPNTATDKMRNVRIRNNVIDASDSLASCGSSTPCTLHGIVVQRVGVAEENYRVEITGNRIIGARINDPSPRISGIGIWITNVPNVKVSGNYIQRVKGGILSSSCSKFEIADNELVSTSFITSTPIMVEGGDVSGVVRNNVVRSDPASALYKGENTMIVERATSGAGVLYAGNRMGPSPGGRGYFLRLPGSRSDEPPQVTGAPRKE